MAPLHRSYWRPRGYVRRRSLHHRHHLLVVATILYYRRPLSFRPEKKASNSDLIPDIRFELRLSTSKQHLILIVRAGAPRYYLTMGDVAVESQAFHLPLHKKASPSAIPNIDSFEGVPTEGGDDYATMKLLQRQLE